MAGKPRGLVTGAAKRVGRAIALELAESGFDLLLHYHQSVEEIEETAAQCRTHGSAVSIVQADLGTLSGCTDVVGAVNAQWDALHVLVNNASVFEPMDFENLAMEDWDRTLHINLRAPFALAQGCLGMLRNADGEDLGAPEGQHGVVVHLCDIGAERPVRGYAHYSASKAGLVMLVKAMAVELAPAVRTVGVSPGQVAWPVHYSKEQRERLAKRIPMGRNGSPEDIARMIRFLVLEGHYVNGEVITVDGGLSCRY